MKIFKINLFILFFMFSLLNAQSFRNVGHSGANFLQIPVEAVGAGLGNSFVAHSKGAEGLYWNPGVITEGEGTEVLLSTVKWIADTRISFFGATHSFDFGTVGVSLTALTMGDMEITTEEFPNGTGQNFSAGSYSFAVSFAKQIIDRFSFGITAKYIYEYIWETHGGTVAFDFGSIYKTDFYNLKIGMRLANFGGDVTFSGSPIDNKAQEILNSGITLPNDPRLTRVSEKYSLPQLFDVGISIDPISTKQHRVTLLASANDPLDNNAHMSFGTEYAFEDLLFLRVGYKSGMEEQDLTLGAGVNFNYMGMNLKFDYAFAKFGILGNNHFISMKFGF